MIESIDILTIKQHFEGKLKGYYTITFEHDDMPVMKSKKKSVLLSKIARYYSGQGE